jgi:RimJ/RimL family protein N-acetyltransferase
VLGYVVAVHHRLVTEREYEVHCWGPYHSIKGDGVRLSTAQGRHLPIVRRCMIDEAAQHYLGWKEEWLETARPPLGMKRRLDIRPRPFYYAEYMMAVRVVDDDEIIGAATVDFPAGDPPHIGVTMRADHRSSGFGRRVAQSLAALLHRHFGERLVDAYTETVNQGGNGVMRRLGGVLVGEALEWQLPNGRAVLHNRYQLEDPGCAQVCRHRLGPPRP